MSSSSGKTRAQSSSPFDDADARIAALERELRDREDLINTIGHELGGPISPVFLQVRVLLSTVRAAGPDGSVPAAKLLPLCEQLALAVETFRVKLERLTDPAQLGVQEVTIRRERVDAAHLVAQVAARFERELAASGSSLVIDAPEQVLGWWDPLRLEQIVSNLLSNAIRYGQGKPISLAVRARDDEASITVRDEGIGIGPDERARIFQRFARAGAHGQGGLGLGLWIASVVCGAMDGTISVESRPGAGATFIVRLPCRLESMA
jgi:signal transduction histidine kinase